MSSSFFELDIILPEQWPLRQNKFAARGERRLQLAVLELAVHEWMTLSRLHPRSMLRHRRELRAWFSQPVSDWPYSFTLLCEGLDLDPGAILAALGIDKEADTR